MENEPDNTRTKRLEQITGMFMLLMWHTSRRYARLLQPFGITFPQFMALSVLYLHPERCTMTDLSNVSPHQDPAAMTGMVNRLMKLGLAERCRSETDRRVVMVGITAAGRTVVEGVHKTFTEENASLHQDITDEELEFAWRLLNGYVQKEMEHYDWIRQDAVYREMKMVEQFMQDPVAFAREEAGRS